MTYYISDMKAISIKLPDPLLHDLAQHDKSGASSQSEIIRTALAASDAQPYIALCAERASRWTGMVQGPADLSTNAKHLKGFGE